MGARLIVIPIFGLSLFALTSLAQAPMSYLGAPYGLVWWFFSLALVVCLFLTLRAPTIRAAWGYISLLNGVLWLSLVPTSMFAPASAMEEIYQPEIITDAAARYAVRTALSGYLPGIALFVALVLIASSLLFLRHANRNRT